MSKNDILMNLAEEAVSKLFSDTSVSAEKTIENLELIIEDCQDRILSLEDK